MILGEDCIGDDFSRGIHWRLILVEECTGDDFSRGIHWR